MESGKAEGKLRRSPTFFRRDTDVEEFLHVLKSKFGSLTRAWRVGLDKDNSGFLDFGEFCAAVKGLGYTGNLRTLWFNLDNDFSGSISLKELDEEAANKLEKFRVRGTMKYDTIERLWNELLDQDRSGNVSLNEFLSHAGELGYNDAEATELFMLLLVRPGATYLKLPDLMFLQGWDETKREQAHRKRLGCGWVNKDPCLYGRARIPGMFSDPDDYENVVAESEEEQRETFKQFLLRQYGSLAKAFDVMDVNESGSLTLTEFQSIVATVQRYCRPADAKRLFLLFKKDKSPLLSWADLGITAQEWMTYTMQKRMCLHQRAIDMHANASAPLGSGARMQSAKSRHEVRVREAKPRADLAFGMPLPHGWGPPPYFEPRSMPLSAR